MLKPLLIACFFMLCSLGTAQESGLELAAEATHMIDRQSETLEIFQSVFKSESDVKRDSLFTVLSLRHDSLSRFFPELTNGYYQAFAAESNQVDSLVASTEAVCFELEKNINRSRMLYFEIFNGSGGEIVVERFSEFLDWYKFYLDGLKSLNEKLKELSNDAVPSYINIIQGQIRRNQLGGDGYQLVIGIKNIGDNLADTSNPSLVITSSTDWIVKEGTLDINNLSKNEEQEIIIELDNGFRSNSSFINLSFSGVKGQSRTVKFEGDESFRRQRLHFKVGWNLISFFVNPDDAAAGALLDNIQEQVVQLKGESNSYDPSLPDYLNTLDRLEPGKGYWIKVSEAIELAADGNILNASQQKLELSEGWNLIAFPKERAQPIEEALATVLEKLVEVKNMNQAFSPELPAFLNTLSTLKPGEGYWIKVKEDCVLDFSKD